ncbi:hypothetical protein J41TS2_48880 [Bacillus sonorensis]|nr:hypothetical protein J41TS2_48880 [Bacillus sonorensis]
MPIPITKPREITIPTITHSAIFNLTLPIKCFISNYYTYAEKDVKFQFKYSYVVTSIKTVP